MRSALVGCCLVALVGCPSDPNGEVPPGSGEDSGGPPGFAADTGGVPRVDGGGDHDVSDTGAAVPEPDAAPPVGGEDAAGADTSAVEPTDAGGRRQVFEPDIVLDPTSYQFSYLSPLTQTLTRQFVVFNQGNGSLIITGVEIAPGSSPDFSLIGVPPLPKTLAPGEHSLAIVRFQEKGGGTGILRITSNDPDTPVAEAELTSHLKGSIVTPEPCVSIAPSALAFGNVVRGQQKTLGATLKNCSDDAPLTITKITRSNFLGIQLTAEMQLTPQPVTPLQIAPGQVLQVAVTYTPLLAGPDFGNFVFHTDDPATPQAQLDVTGNGVQPPVEEIGLRIKLSWDSNDTDVDSHLIRPGGSFFDCESDCHFGNPSPDWGIKGDWKDDPFLDVDDVDGFGPEYINISEPMVGTYKYVVHYYDDTHEGSSSSPANATVEVWTYGQKVGTFGPVHLDQTNRNWDVFTVDWPDPTPKVLGATYMITSSQVKACFNFPWP